jgi:hypothetical protein
MSKAELDYVITDKYLLQKVEEILSRFKMKIQIVNEVNIKNGQDFNF